MRLVDVITAPWAIMPERLTEIAEIYATHLRGERIDVAGIEAKLGRELKNEARPYAVVGSVAVVPLVGVLAKRANLFMRVSGGASTQIAADMLDQAAADETVKAIVLEIDSPGGQVDGVQSLAGKVAAIRATGKPVVAWATGYAASGAYWIASAAERVFVADQTTVVGSIGVVATHVDASRAREAAGFRTTEIVAGKYKRIASDNAPLSEEGRAVLQAQVDAIYEIFVQDVARGRGVSVERVLSDMADGRVFMGSQAVTAGLVDGVSTLEDLIAKMQPRAGVARAPMASATNNPKGPNAMNRDELKAQFPALFDALLQEGRTAGVQEGTSTERARVLGVLAVAAPGHEKAARAAIEAGAAPGEYALSVLASEKAQREAALAAQRDDALKAKAETKDEPPTDAAKKITRREFDALDTTEQRAKIKAGVAIVD